ncbi:MULTISPECIES: DUF3021 family protein [unclassified Streptococcus]|uniref:DUF3021 family protein n=1 Tax=unclassified Streptococcus TaxID=2608887 RepID=UPI0011B4C5D5|nr:MULTISPECIES: DUF3021 family protein [unclassified Streptococcus]TWS94590.1 DUF3021 domain-containing protein [Streptococcus sp. sy018]TWT14425.1 DUF3021 domain-containing protein [Streptococcus sp. sy010]
MKLLKSFIIGVGIEAIIFLCYIVAIGFVPTAYQLISVLGFGGLMGVAALILDLESINFVSRLVLHFCSIFLLVVVMLLSNQWLDMTNILSIVPSFVFIYVVIWLVSFSYDIAVSKKINQHLKKNLDK